MKFLFIVFLFTACLSASAQDLHLSLFGGFANYQGDLQDKRFTVKQSHGAFGAGILYDINEYFSLRVNATFATVSGDDRLGKNKERNLSFSSKVNDYHLGIQCNFLDIDDYGFTPYIFTGISIFQFDPTAVDSGVKYHLQKLGTEGQGFYLNRKKYSLTQLAIPFGAGVKLALGDNMTIGAEAGFRKTSTDYLDDVSTGFADKDDLAARNGQKAVSLAFRGNEVKSGTTYPSEGAQRGSPKNKDWYYFTGIVLTYRFHHIDGSGRGGRVRCPSAR